MNQTPASLEALIAARLARRKAVSRPEPSREPPSLSPLSSAQERLWFLEQVTPGSAIYNMPLAFLLDGFLDLAVLQSALDQLVARHQPLRTRIGSDDGLAHLVIDPDGMTTRLRLERVAEADWPAAAQREAERPFDLAAEHPIRAALLVLGSSRHVLVLTLHHIAADGWSVGILTRELSLLYRSALRQEQAPLKPLRASYAELALRERERRNGSVATAHLDFWRDALEGAPATIELPTDRPRPPVATGRGAWQRLVFAPELISRLKASCAAGNATLFMGMLASFALLLRRFSGERDMVIGVPVAGRSSAEAEDLVGLFVDMLPLRIVIAEEETFRSLLAAVRRTTLGTYTHQSVRLDQIIEAVAPFRDLSQQPLFQVSLAMQPVSQAALDLPDVVARAFGVETRTAKYDLTVVLWETPEGGVEGTLEFATDLFDAATVARLIAHWLLLLEGAIDAPDQLLALLPILSSHDRQKILVSWNETDRPLPQGTLAEKFDAVADRYPDAIALDGAFGTLTYGALQARANQLAHFLQAHGAGPEIVTGVMAARSIEMIVAVLAVLKAGSAFLPLDPAYPAERLRAMVAHASPRLLVTHAAASEAVAADGMVVVDLRTDAAAIAACPPTPPPCAATADSLAYLIYTSGSTGTPKSVAMPQFSLLNLIGWHLDAIGVNRVLQATSLSFDLSQHEMFTALFGGSTLILIDDVTRADPDALLDFIVAHRVEDLHAPQTLLHALAEAAQTRGLLDLPLRAVFQGGEALTLTTEIVALFDLRSRATLWNLYGATEVHVASAVAIPTPLRGQPIRPPVGGQIWNTRFYVLDEHRQPVPIGVSGEVLIGGIGIARGYHGAPELTAAKFIENPFIAGEMLYCTGDRARWRDDGLLEFLGRRDHQVKVRGFRVELGEVEAALHLLPAVHEAIVTAPSVNGERLLVAYVVPVAGNSIDGATLRRTLADTLPDFMIPEQVVMLEALPLTPNGKVDRNALPAPARAIGGGTRAAWRTLTEELLSTIWADVLANDGIRPDDNFFDIGGHSLKAMRVLARIGALFGTRIPLRALFEAPTIRMLAARLDQVRREEGGDTPDPVYFSLTSIQRPTALPLTSAQARLWFLEQLGQVGSAYVIAGFLRRSGALDRAALVAALTALIDRHEALRSRFENHHGNGAMIVDPPGAPAVAWRGPTTGEAETWRLIQAEVERPIDIATGPLFRAVVVETGPEEYVVVLLMHHIVSDGWSMRIIARDLAALYDAASKGREARLPALPIQYADFALWERQWLAGDRLTRLLAYWTGQLKGAPDHLTLPTDKSRPTILSTRGARVTRMLPFALTDAVAAFANCQHATPFIVLLAAFHAVLARWSGQNDIVVGCPVAARERPETENLVGFFANTLALRIDASDNPTFTEFVRRARETTLAAFDHQDMPFDKLVETLRPERDLSRHPLFQVMINSIEFGEHANAGEDGVFTVDSGDALEPSSKFELTLYLRAVNRETELVAVFATDLFEAPTIAMLLDQLTHLLENCLAHPERPMDSVTLAPNSFRVDLPAASWPGSVAARIVEIGEQRGDAPAVVGSDGTTLSYRMLNSEAERIARRLVAGRVTPGDAILVLARRDARLPCAVLAAMRAGATFAILDLDQPDSRLRAMARTIDPTMAISLDRLPPLLDTWLREMAIEVIVLENGVIVLDDNADFMADMPVPLPNPSAVDPDGIAYFVFTSGTTGEPRAIASPHRALSHFLEWQAQTFAISPNDRVPLLSGLGHDPILRDLFAPLWSGGCLCVPPAGGVLAPKIAEWLVDSAITIVHWTPSMNDAALAGTTLLTTTLRLAFFGGEPLSPRQVLATRRFAPAARCINVYGSSETPQVAAYQIVDERRLGTRAMIPIGEGIEGMDVQVRSRSGAIAATNELGEVAVRTAYLAQGYVGDPTLTAARFIDGDGAGNARTYLTGDLARRRGDGSIELAGRRDRQVKLGGVRVELDEIEQALLDQPSVSAALAIVRAAATGEGEHLIGYIVAAPDTISDTTALAAALRDRLPTAMRPEALIVLSAIPLTANGKVDLARLPALARAETAKGRNAPTTPEEREVASIWAEMLNLDSVSPADNFFLIGGFSLLAVRMMQRLRDAFGVALPLGELFMRPTLAALAARIVELRRDGAVSPQDS